MSLDLSVPIRTAILTSAIAPMLTVYQGAPAIFTRRPIPPDVVYPIIVVSPDVALTDLDGVNDQRPVIVRDINIYGQNSTSAFYRAVEVIAYMVRDLFQRKPRSIVVPGWSVVQIIAAGPRIGPVDDDNTVGRIVTLTIQLAAKAA